MLLSAELVNFLPRKLKSFAQGGARVGDLL